MIGQTYVKIFLKLHEFTAKAKVCVYGFDEDTVASDIGLTVMYYNGSATLYMNPTGEHRVCTLTSYGPADLVILDRSLPFLERTSVEERFETVDDVTVQLC